MTIDQWMRNLSLLTKSRTKKNLKARDELIPVFIDWCEENGYTDLAYSIRFCLFQGWKLFDPWICQGHFEFLDPNRDEKFGVNILVRLDGKIEFYRFNREEC